MNPSLDPSFDPTYLLDAMSTWWSEAWGGSPAGLTTAGLNSDLSANIMQAGGSAQDAVDAVAEQNSFLATNWPPRDPLQTVYDLASGNPLGLPKSAANPDYTALLWLLLIVLVAYLGVKLVMKAV